jgi:hypothetical protein
MRPTLPQTRSCGPAPLTWLNFPTRRNYHVGHIVGDADGVKPEHAVAMFELRGGRR